MKIELTDPETKLIRDLLAKDLEQTRSEAHHTKNLTFKGDLENHRTQVKTLLVRLDAQ